MKTIYKYPLQMLTELDLPVGAQILSVHVQNDTTCLWALVTPGAATEKRIFAIYGTGHEVSDMPKTFIGTLHYGSFVFHVFELTAATGVPG